MSYVTLAMCSRSRGPALHNVDQCLLVLARDYVPIIKKQPVVSLRGPQGRSNGTNPFLVQ